MRSFESGVQAIPEIGRLSKVRRRGSPPFNAITYTSLATPAMVPRTNANALPSGENAGSRSRYASGGEVSCRVLASASENIVMAEFELPETVRGNTSSLPSGDQFSQGYWTHAML